MGGGGNSTHDYHQMVNTEIRLIIFFSAEDEEKGKDVRSYHFIHSFMNMYVA